MTSPRIAKRNRQKPTASPTPRLTVVLNDELDQWIKSGAKTAGLAEGTFVRMKLTELKLQQAGN